MQQLRLFFIALQFFTRLPIPRWVGFEPAAGVTLAARRSDIGTKRRSG